ncbi:21070_t:CDS:1, partial [Gigaspora margarita]
MKERKQLSKNSFNASNKGVKLRYRDNNQYTPASFEIKSYKSKINKKLRQFQKHNSPNNNHTPDLMRKLEMFKNMHNRKLQDFARELENQRDLKYLNCSKTVPNDSEQQEHHDYSMQTSSLYTLPCYYSANCEF